jgi:hypothetical protein
MASQIRCDEVHTPALLLRQPLGVSCVFLLLGQIDNRALRAFHGLQAEPRLFGHVVFLFHRVGTIFAGFMSNAGSMLRIDKYKALPSLLGGRLKFDTLWLTP